MTRGVHRYKRTHIELAALDRGVPQAGFHAELRAEQLAHRSARAGAHVALRHRALIQARSVFASRIPHGGVRSHISPANLQVEERDAPHTSGTRATPTSKPKPRSSSHRMTPDAASSPYAEPPESTTA